MTESKNDPAWKTNLNLEHTKVPLNNMLKALKEIEKDYKRKREDFIRIKKGLNGTTL